MAKLNNTTKILAPDGVKKSRRSVLIGLAAASVLTAPSVALAAANVNDAELLGLTARYWQTEALRPDELREPAAYEKFLDDMDDLTNRIAAIPARTPQGLAEKALIALDHDMLHDRLTKAVAHDAVRLRS